MDCVYTDVVAERHMHVEEHDWDSGYAIFFEEMLSGRVIDTSLADTQEEAIKIINRVLPDMFKDNDKAVCAILYTQDICMKCAAEHRGVIGEYSFNEDTNKVEVE